MMEIYAREHWNVTGLFLEEGATYELKSSGEWLDHKDKFSPAGKEAPGFHLGDLVRFQSGLLGKLEDMYKGLAHRKDVDFWWTRRDEHAPWFALMGFVANAVGASDATLPEGETFVIGESAEFTPRMSGYLYCFANDAWQTYGNNRGSVTLTVTRAS
jgi:hypothetical protein